MIVHQTELTMIDPDTFLTELYVMADDFCKSQPQRTRPGKAPALSQSEIVTLALFGQFSRFRTERDFYRLAQAKLRAAFPDLPDRTQFNRLVRATHASIVAFFCHLAERLDASKSLYEAIDTTAVPVRNAKRRGRGHLSGQADIGYTPRIGWYEGFHVLASVTSTGIITGFGFAAASTKEQPLAEVFFALRANPEEAAACGAASVGKAPSCPYVADKGFEGEDRYGFWRTCYGAEVITAPKRSTTKRRWPKALRRWLASLHQLVETAIGALEAFFHLGADRPHTVDGFRARLAAKMALFNFCIWLNRKLGRPDLAFADLLDW